MHDKNLLINAMAERKPIEHSRKYIGHCTGILCGNLASKSIHLIHVNAFVVAYKNKWISFKRVKCTSMI